MSNVTRKCLTLQVSVKRNVTGECLTLQVSVKYARQVLPVTLYVTVSSNTVTLFGNTFLLNLVRLECKVLKTLHFYLTTNSGTALATVLVPAGNS